MGREKVGERKHRSVRNKEVEAQAKQSVCIYREVLAICVPHCNFLLLKVTLPLRAHDKSKGQVKFLAA
jgi:hypothetical protein